MRAATFRAERPVRFRIPLAVSTAVLAIAGTSLGCGWFGAASASAPDPLYHGPLPTKAHHFGADTGRDRPWEVVSDEGEFLVPDVYYAEALQNEQIMPVSLNDGGPRPYQIDRLIYPTIGNPNLFVKGKADGQSDTLFVVLRIEPELLKHLGPGEGQAHLQNPWLREMAFKTHSNGNEVRFRLLPRSARAAVVSPAVVQAGFEIRPAQIYRHSQEAMPVELRARDTLQFRFQSAELKNVPPDFYDLRFEVLRGGRVVAYEYQYNAIRVFPEGADLSAYHVLNVTDSQVSVSEILDGIVNKQSFKSISHDRLRQFADYVNRSDEPQIRGASFITFNGDLHNGGSPGTLLPEDVATTYRREAEAILSILKSLRVPIFLTAGNHDGYASLGHVPAPIASGIEKKRTGLAGKRTLREAVLHILGNRGPGAWKELAAGLERTRDRVGGRHVDIFQGAFIRRGRTDESNTLYWQLLPKEYRNVMLYDGFHQWRRTYGPLYASWNFGRNHYINVNSYDLRQHRRTGWGMYTVNYGGGISSFQMDWFNRDIKRSDGKFDIVILAHHDPRGGHNGRDYPYYFGQINFTGMDRSAVNYVNGEVLNPLVCGRLTGWAMTKSFALNCLHDGLQEWMRADSEFDCDNRDLHAEGPLKGRCDTERFRSRTFFGNPRHPVYSGYQFLHKLARYASIRTLLLGHTHYNSMEMLQPGDEIVPGHVILDYDADRHYARIEVNNPLREDSYADTRKRRKKPKLDKLDYVMVDGRQMVRLDLLKSGHDFRRKLEGHELAVLRLTSVAELTLQANVLDGSAMFGFSAFEVSPKSDARNYSLPQINRVTYFQNRHGSFSRVNSVELDRTKRWKSVGPENPLLQLFTMAKKKKAELEKQMERPEEAPPTK